MLETMVEFLNKYKKTKNYPVSHALTSGMSEESKVFENDKFCFVTSDPYVKLCSGSFITTPYLFTQGSNIVL